MALQHLRSSTADKRPTPAAMAEGQLALNSAAVSPGLFFKNASGALVKVGPVHVGTTAPNATPASGGESGNSVGEQWLDTSGTNPVLKIWDGSTWASEAGEFVNASGDTMTGALVMDNQQQVRFRETTANGTNYIAIQAPASVAADRTLTLPDVDGTLVSSGDTGTVTSTMILDGTIVNADINASAAIVDTKLDTIATAGKVSNSATTATNANTASAIVARDGSGNFSAGTITAALTGAASANVLKAGDTMTGVLAVTAGTAALPAITPSGDPNTGIFSPGADQLAISTNGTGRLTVGTTAVSSTLAVDHPLGAVGTPSITFTGDLNTGFWSPTADTLAASTNGAERLRITSTGAVGIGTTTVSSPLHVKANSTEGIRIESPDFTGIYGLLTSRRSSGAPLDIAAIHSVGSLAPEISFSRSTNGSTFTESARIDSSGRLLVGTSSVTTAGVAADISLETVDPRFNIIRKSNNAAGPALGFGKTRSTGSPGTVVQSGDKVGTLVFYGDDGSTLNSIAGRIDCEIDGTPGANDMPGRLVFSTTADGASSPTERMRIDSAGRMLVGTSANSGGARIQASGSVQASLAFRVPANNRNGGTCKPIAIETISTDGGTNTATTYGNSRYGTGKWVLLAAFNPSGDAVSATTNVGTGSTFVFCITDAASNFPTS
jgi:hypothetical protein